MKFTIDDDVLQTIAKWIDRPISAYINTRPSEIMEIIKLIQGNVKPITSEKVKIKNESNKKA